jgi:hypothetical protein
MTLFFLVVGVNYVVDQYGRGVMRDAVDEGARAGAQLGAPPGACEDRANQAIHNLMAGRLSSTVAVTCSSAGGNVVATATATFPSWLPAVPAWTMTVTGEAHVEDQGAP